MLCIFLLSFKCILFLDVIKVYKISRLISSVFWLIINKKKLVASLKNMYVHKNIVLGILLQKNKINYIGNNYIYFPLLFK